MLEPARRIPQELRRALLRVARGFPGIVGFGSYHYVYDSGREGDMCLTGFSSRKTSLSIYIMSGFDDRPDLMEQLCKYKTGKSCLYVKRLSDIDLDVLDALIEDSIRVMKDRYGSD